jgi:hypothetical protein
MTVLAALASQREGLYSTPSRESPEGATQTFKKGAVLVASGGNLVEGGVDPTGIVGIAEDDGDNLGAGLGTVRYVPALPHVTFDMSLSGTIAATDLHVKYGLVKSGNNWGVDKAETVNTRVVIVGFKDPVGTVDGRVYVRFLAASTIYG